MPSRSRGNTLDLVVDVESSFDDSSGLFAGSESHVRAWGVETGDVDYELFADQAMRDHGDYAPIVGPAYDRLALPFNTYAEGLGSGATGAAGVTAIAKLIAAALQSSPDSTTGDTVASASSATVVVGNNPGNGAPSGTYGIAGVEMSDGSVCWRPYTYDTDTYTFLVALRETPAPGAQIYATTMMEYAQGWSGAAAVSLAMRVVGDADHLNRQIGGAVTSFGIADMVSKDAPVMSWTTRGASFTEPTGLSKSSATYNRPLYGNGEFTIGAYGSSVAKSIQAIMASFELNRTYNADVDGNEAENCGGWTSPIASPNLTLTMPGAETPPAACTAASFKAMLRAATPEQMWTLSVLGRQEPGKTIIIWTPRVFPSDVMTGVDGDDMSIQTATLTPWADSTEAPVYVAIG